MSRLASLILLFSVVGNCFIAASDWLQWRGPTGQGHSNDETLAVKWSEEKIERFIRAMTHPPYSFATYKGVEIKSISEFKNIVNEE